MLLMGEVAGEDEEICLCPLGKFDLHNCEVLGMPSPGTFPPVVELITQDDLKIVISFYMM